LIDVSHEYPSLLKLNDPFVEGPKISDPDASDVCRVILYLDVADEPTLLGPPSFFIVTPHSFDRQKMSNQIKQNAEAKHNKYR
jgi:hypothetical protein